MGVGYRRKKSAAGLDEEGMENGRPYKPDSILCFTCIYDKSGQWSDRVRKSMLWIWDGT